jgi:hypothetical protein
VKANYLNNLLLLIVMASRAQRSSPSAASRQRRNFHYFGVFVALVGALVLFGVYAPVSFTGDITGGQIVDVFSSGTPLSAFLLFGAIALLLLLFVFTHRLLSRVL